MNTRTGKIARLPKKIREQLNRRLENGKQGPELLKWLNALSETKELLAEKFEGRPITHQNLSEWRRAGYQDWLQQQQRIDWFDHFCENEVELAKHENCGDTFEAMSRIFIVEIGQSIAALRNLKNPQERSYCLQNLAREFARLQNAFNFSRKTQLAFDKHNGLPAAEPEPSIEDDDEYEEPADEEIESEHDLANDDAPQPLGAPASRRPDATTSPEPHTKPEASSPSPPQKGGDGWGKNSPAKDSRIEPLNLEKPTTSVSLSPSGGAGRVEGALTAQGDHQVCPPTEDCGPRTEDLSCQAIPTPAPPRHPANRQPTTPSRKPPRPSANPRVITHAPAVAASDTSKADEIIQKHRNEILITHHAPRTTPYFAPATI
jgi:hypothetical protein